MADYNPLGKSRLPRILEGDFPGHFNIDSENPIVDFDNPFEYEVGRTFQELLDLMLSKHKDYGPKNISEAPGGAINGLRVRMHDKLARINNLYDSNNNPNHESLEDSFKDMANYAIIGLLVLRGKWDR